MFRATTFAAIILLVASQEALAQNLPPPGAYQPIPNFTGVGAGLQFREAINDRFSGAQPIAPSIASPAFANLPPEQDGMLLFCKDCRNATPCVSGGGGAWALGTRGQWSCASAALEANLNANGNKVSNLASATVNGDALAFGQTGAQLNTLSGSKLDGSDAIANVSLNGVRNAADYGAISGSQNTGSVTISAGSQSATLAAAGNWKSGNGIGVPGAGPTPSITTPTAPSVTATCTGTCATAYTYKVAALDGKCGETAASVASTSVNNAVTLTEAKFNTLTIPTANGYTAFVVYRGTSPIAIIPASEENASNVSPATYYRDIGASAITISSPCLSATPPSSVGADALYTTITSGAGTTTLTLANAATTSVTSQTSYHDDSAAIAAAATPASYATGVRVALPPNMTFVVSQPIVIGGAPGASNNTWAGIQLTGGSYTSIATTPMMQGMSVIKGVNTFQMATDGINIDGTNGTPLCGIEHNVNSPVGGTGGAYVGESQDSNLNDSTGNPYYGICYTAAAGYDQNNSENTIRNLNCHTANAGIFIGHSNALQNTIMGGNFSGGLEGAIELHGGSFNESGGALSSNTWLFDFEAGTYDHLSTATGITTESGAGTLYADANTFFSGSSAGLFIANSDLGTDSSLTGGLAIDVESTSFNLRLDDDRFPDGGYSANITFKGYLATIDHSWMGAVTIVNGTGSMSIWNTNFASGWPTVTSSGTFCGSLNSFNGSSDGDQAANACTRAARFAINLDDLGVTYVGTDAANDFSFGHNPHGLGVPGADLSGDTLFHASAIAGATTAEIDPAGRWNSAVAQTTVTGPTAGTATCSEPLAGGSFKVVNCLLTAYQETGTAQTVCFNGSGCTVNLAGANFNAAPNLFASCGTYEPTATATVLTLPANASMTAETCNITAIGQ